MNQHSIPVGGLRPYQSKAVDDLRRSMQSGAKAPLLVAPCGSGKTIKARAIIESAVGKGSRVLFLAPRRELIFQTSEKLDAAGIHHGVIMAGVGQDGFAPVQVACIPTMHRRLTASYAVLPKADLIIVDEAHLALSKSTIDIIEAYPDARVIGLTATPCRSDGAGLGQLFDGLVLGPSMRELIDGGYLVQPRYFAPSKPDLEGIKIRAGDYAQEALGERMDQPQLIGDVVSNWARIAGDRQTVVFAVTVKHSRHLREQFQAIGVRAEHLDAKTPTDERREILRRFESGETQVICNCQIFSYGLDCPPASACVLAHPTKSLARYIQAVGRVLRPYPGKTDCLVIDHAGIVEDLGFVEDDQPWSLDGKERISERQASTRKEPKPITCTQCDTVFGESATCPHCGYTMKDERKEAIEALEADLAEVDRKTRAAAKREWTPERKQRFYSELLSICKQRGYKPGWAANKYKSRTNVWPRGLSHVSVTPSPETLAWVRSRDIAYAKSREKANG